MLYYPIVSEKRIKDSILVRGVNWIGDAVMTLPALRALRKVYPESHISLLVKPSVAPIFEKDPSIDRIVLYEDHFKGVIGKLRLAYRLRKMGFSKAVLFQNAFDAAVITFFAGIPERVGYGRDRRGFLLTKPIPFNDDDKRFHHIDYYLNLISELQAPSSKLQTNNFHPWIYLSIDERLAARERLSQLKRPILGINPGATYGPAKRWFPERFAEVAGWFIRDTGGSVVIFGGHSEVETAEEIFQKLTLNLPTLNFELRTQKSELSFMLNLTGKTSLRELIILISECDAFVTNDSGPMHISYAVGTPLVAIFGSTDPELTGPVGDGNEVIKCDLSCSPCFERRCKYNDMRCMYAITSEDVYHGIKKIIPDGRAVFFDRDGTLCKDVGYLCKWDNFEILTDVSGLIELKARGFKLIGVTNQSGIARGIVDERFVREVNRVFIDKYGFDDFYYCPHHPDERCSCRKPEPGMVLTARAKNRINLRESYVVGDKEADMLLAKSVGAKAILVLTGQHKESSYADFVAKDLKEAADFIVRDSGGG